ncbi:MAG TPA: hypothetical protein VH640_11000 [Bryobacteraceae bacterium]|jgi:hypothetical protein
MSETHRRRLEEARAYACFAVQDAEEQFRLPLADLYEHCHLFIGQHLGARQSLPHLRFGRTAARSLSHLAEHTGHGARWDITFNEGLAVDVDPRLVINPLPAPGCRRFLHHLLERHLVQQCVWEVVGSSESGYGGFGPHFCDMANRISLARGRDQVIPRRRGPEDADALLAKSWPHGPELAAEPDCYAEDMSQTAIALAVGSSARQAAPRAAAPTLGVWQWVLYLLAAGRTKDLRRMSAAQVDRMHAQQNKRFPVLARFETGREEEDGTPIAQLPEFNPAWLSWQGGIVRSVLHGIHDFRAYLELPILADALEEAGCTDCIILRHLRARTKGHDARCWVVNGLLGCESADQGISRFTNPSMEVIP